MRVMTRGDFDGLVCCVLLGEAERVDRIAFVHPRDAQEGRVRAGPDDIVVNLPRLPGCALWFDHQIAGGADPPAIPPAEGRYEAAPSCARVIDHHYRPAHADALDRHAHLVDAADRLGAAALTAAEITDPAGWMLVGLSLDPRSGLGPEFRRYFRWLADYVAHASLEEVLLHPEVKLRGDRLRREREEFLGLLAERTRREGSVVVTDLRGIRDRPAGNRYLVFTLFPDATVELRIFDGQPGTVVASVGHNIFNRASRLDAGALCRDFGGGGQPGAGTCQFPAEQADAMITSLFARIRAEA